MASTNSRLLSDAECRHYRDLFRAARYAALANAEGFDEICFSLEALGLRLLGQQGDLGRYRDPINAYAWSSLILNELPKAKSSAFKTFDALYETVRNARNDNMHIGAYARHATTAAIELCIGLEEALMVRVKRTVGDLMVKSPISVEPWQVVAHARQLMLMHSFSFLPVWRDNRWSLLSELSLAKFLNVSQSQRCHLLGLTIEAASDHSPKLFFPSVEVSQLLTVDMTIDNLLDHTDAINGPTLWLVVDNDRKGHLVGVLSPFELM